MKKSSFVFSICTLALVLFLAGVRPVAAIELKLAHFMPPVHIQHQKNFIPFAENVARLSGGEVTIKIYPGGTLGGPRELYDSVKTGITDLAFIIPSYVTGRFPRSSVFELPFLFDNGLHLTRTAYKVYDSLIAPDFNDVKLLYIYSPGLGQFMSATKPIHTAEDLVGYKMRSPNSLMTMLLRDLGANPVGMPISELSISLEKRIIDGVLTPYSAMSDFKLFNYISSVTEANVYGTFMAVVMNRKKFESLSPRGQKAIIDASTQDFGLEVARIYQEHDQAAIDQIMAQKDRLKLEKFGPLEMEKMRLKAKGVYEDWIKTVSAKGIDAQGILEAVRAAADEVRRSGDGQ